MAHQVEVATSTFYFQPHSRTRFPALDYCELVLRNFQPGKSPCCHLHSCWEVRRVTPHEAPKQSAASSHKSAARSKEIFSHSHSPIVGAKYFSKYLCKRLRLGLTAAAKIDQKYRSPITQHTHRESPICTTTTISLTENLPMALRPLVPPGRSRPPTPRRPAEPPRPVRHGPWTRLPSHRSRRPPLLPLPPQQKALPRGAPPIPPKPQQGLKRSCPPRPPEQVRSTRPLPQVSPAKDASVLHPR